MRGKRGYATSGQEWSNSVFSIITGSDLPFLTCNTVWSIGNTTHHVSHMCPHWQKQAHTHITDTHTYLIQLRYTAKFPYDKIENRVKLLSQIVVLIWPTQKTKTYNWISCSAVLQTVQLFFFKYIYIYISKTNFRKVITGTVWDPVTMGANTREAT